MKARILAETLVERARIGEVADRHGVAPQYLTTWRKLARELVKRIIATHI